MSTEFAENFFAICLVQPGCNSLNVERLIFHAPKAIVDVECDAVGKIIGAWNRNNIEPSTVYIYLYDQPQQLDRPFLTISSIY